MLRQNQKISVGAALRVTTPGAAFRLKLDGEIGAIETGKKADSAYSKRIRLLYLHQDIEMECCRPASW